MTQGFEQTRKAMESYLDFVQKNVKAAPWLDTDLTKKMKPFTEQNIAAASEFAQKASKGFSRLLAHSDRVYANAMEGFH